MMTMHWQKESDQAVQKKAHINIILSIFFMEAISQGIMLHSLGIKARYLQLMLECLRL